MRGLPDVVVCQKFDIKGLKSIAQGCQWLSLHFLVGEGECEDYSAPSDADEMQESA